MKLRFSKPKARVQKRPYILPTKFGVLFGVAVFLMLTMALSYANNMVFFVCFFLASLGFVSMILTNNNIQRVQIGLEKKEFLFADDKSELLLFLKSAEPSFSIEVTLNNKKNPVQLVSSKPHIVKFNNLKFCRGWNHVPALTIESTFPFFLCRSWKKFNLKEKILVYPAREGSLELPERKGSALSTKNPTKIKNDDDDIFIGHTPYQKHESIKKIDWKASARTQKLLTKKFENHSNHDVLIQWQDTNHLDDFEKRISQLCTWLCVAEKKNLHYQLCLPHFTSEKGKGTVHLKSCLETLALWQNTSESIPNEIS